MAPDRTRKRRSRLLLRYAEASGWRISVGGSHAWGKLYCPYDDEDCRCGQFCITSVWSTPKNPGNEARKIKRVIDNCAARMVELEGERSAEENGHD